jgi:DNA-binding SARP family transcriptional activator
VDRAASTASHPVFVCLLGNFRLVKLGRSIAFRTSGGKAEALLTSLALRDRHHAPRETLMESLWPQSDSAHASRSLTTLVHELRGMLSDALAGASPVQHADEGYELNVGAGVGIDVAEFDALVGGGERHLRAGDQTAGVRSYEAAVGLYRGDVCSVRDVRAIVERERIRARYLSLLGYLADHDFRAAEYPMALQHAGRLLSCDPCREDGHRLVMCYCVRLGARAQALRQYRRCEEILAREFDTGPEPATVALFERVRTDPAWV